MHQTDILVIGGGIAGTATTCYLSQYGHEVTLLEQSELATEASGLNAGTIWASGWGHTPDLSSTLSMGSLEIFKTLQLDLGYDIEFRQSGSLQAIQTEEQYAFAQEEVREWEAQGHQVELLAPRDARSIEPELSTGGQKFEAPHLTRKEEQKAFSRNREHWKTCLRKSMARA